MNMISPGLLRRPWTLIGLLLALFILILLSSRSDRAQEWTSTVKNIASHNAPPPSQPNAAQLHVIMPATDADVNMCKTVLSATLLGYGSPTLYNWETSNAQMAKITGALSYLDSMDEAHDEDLILILQGPSPWFQLPATVLIDRYHEVNADANERIQRMGNDAPGKGIYNAPDQKIIFAAQKKCWPGDGADISCQSVPESPLPDDLYGSKTDQMSKDDFNPYSTLRPRWLNAEIILGPVKDMRALFERATEIGELYPDAEGHEKAVFNQIFGEQEHQRMASRLVPRSETPESFVPEPGRNYEFGIGLDYESALSMPTIFSEYDAAFVTFDKNDTIEAAVKENKISTPRTEVLDTDVAAATLPYAILASNHIEPPNPWFWYQNTSTRWEEIPLFTNLYTGITPAIILNDAHKGDMKKRWVDWWNKMWYQPMARDLLDARLAQPEAASAVDKDGRQWWSAISRVTVEMEGFGVQVDDGKGERGWMVWAELCTEEDQGEIFRDGRGLYKEDTMAGG